MFQLKRILARGPGADVIIKPYVDTILHETTKQNIPFKHMIFNIVDVSNRMCTDTNYRRIPMFTKIVDYISWHHCCTIRNPKFHNLILKNIYVVKPPDSINNSVKEKEIFQEICKMPHWTSVIAIAMLPLSCHIQGEAYTRLFNKCKQSFHELNEVDDLVCNALFMEIKSRQLNVQVESADQMRNAKESI